MVIFKYLKTVETLQYFADNFLQLIRKNLISTGRNTCCRCHLLFEHLGKYSKHTFPTVQPVALNSAPNISLQAATV